MMRFAFYFACFLISKDVDAFLLLSQPNKRCNNNKGSLVNSAECLALWGQRDNSQESDEDVNLADWRKFRASLIASEQNDSVEESEGPEDDTASPTSPVNHNALLLQDQNAALADEYNSGVWAHTVPELEIGGLLCRLPLEAQLYFHGEGHWKEKLSTLLQLDPPPTEATKSESVEHWMNLGERMISRELEMMSGKAKNGILNPNDLDEDAKELVLKYLYYKQSWQEVCLALSKTSAVVINRPIAKSINRQLAQMLLEGAPGSKAKVAYDFQFIDKFVAAFGQEGVVYKGGPEDPLEPALVLHGISDLEGASEVALGTGIYQGGIEAAVYGILEGQYKPLEFRFFLGRHSSLKPMLQDGAYQPIACSRSLALKQCLGLPKPLWHEVLELCGGVMKSISEVELQKRVDLQ